MSTIYSPQKCRTSASVCKCRRVRVPSHHAWFIFTCSCLQNMSLSAFSADSWPIDSGSACTDRIRHLTNLTKKRAPQCRPPRCCVCVCVPRARTRVRACVRACACVRVRVLSMNVCGFRLFPAVKTVNVLKNGS